VHEDAAETQFAPPLAKGGEIGGVVVGEAPCARALDEELERVDAQLVRAFERLFHTA